ncbi:HAMP domain-containing sensor histidine kinase [Oceanobacillus senegalensis]|uniref:HAMP domain-containing sensor histidine kinase n=1 Tax=Oceanobacillus senegalensis TaxID=1936063 RepID=UPI000A30B08E|nr:HAMP domain-containing histidine kinase [Oceanobacillus senegalensis]
MKLRTKIQLFSSLFMLVLILIVNVSIYFLFYKMSTNAELEELEMVTNDVITTLNENPAVDPSDLMKAYLPANGMIRIISENETWQLEQTRKDDYLSLPLHFTNSESQRIVTGNNGPDIAVIDKPIIWKSGEHAGEVVTIQVSNQLVTLYGTMRTLLYVLGTLSILVLIPVIFASSVLSRFLLTPIQNLIKTMKENMKQGNWKKISMENRSQDEIYEMESTFNKMIEHLKENYEKQEIFVSDASHELKTPIQIIKSYAQLLDRRGNLNQDIFKESVSAIDSEADRMKKLVEQMLALAKNKQVELNDTINLVELIDEAVTTFRGGYSREIKYKKDIEVLFVQGNRGQLEQIIYILIENAMKYSDREIDVCVFQEKEEAFFEVRDYGQGISKEDQKRVFDRFYRVDKARSRDTGGTGLGLSIAKTIAEIHHGDLMVNSELGVGSTFTLRLHVHEEKALEKAREH